PQPREGPRAPLAGLAAGGGEQDHRLTLEAREQPTAGPADHRAVERGEHSGDRGVGLRGDHVPDATARRVIGSRTMEDRVTPVLYLEMTEDTPEPYAAERVPAVLGLPGVTRATWWRNVYRDRPDLPRELPEFDTLAGDECSPSFGAPQTPARHTVQHITATRT